MPVFLRGLGAPGELLDRVLAMSRAQRAELVELFKRDGLQLVEQLIDQVDGPKAFEIEIVD